MTETASGSPTEADEHSQPQEAPATIYEHEGRLKIIITGIDKDLQQKASEAASAALRNKRLGDGTGGGFRGFLRHVVRGNLKEVRQDLRSIGRNVRYGGVASGYYHEKLRQQQFNTLRDSGDLLIDEEDEAVKDDMRTYTTLRFMQEFDEAIHTEAGEKRTVLDFEINDDGTRNEKAHEFKGRIVDLIKRAARGEFDEDGQFNEAAFNEEKKRMLNESIGEGLTEDLIGPGMLYLDNLLQITVHVRAAIAHKEMLGEDVDVDEYLDNSDIILGQARVGSTAEIRETRAEQIFNGLNKLGWINEATLATAVAISYSAVAWGVKAGVGKVVASVMIPGLTGGVWAALRKNAAFKERRTQLIRDKSEGKLDTESLTPEERAILESVYEMKPATDLIAQLGLLYDNGGKLRIGEKESFQEAVFLIAEAQSRIRLSDQKNDVELIGFTKGKRSEEKFELDLALAKAKSDLRKFLQDTSDDDLEALGILPEIVAKMRQAGVDPLNLWLEPTIEGTSGVLDAAVQILEKGDESRGEVGMDAKDRLANKLRGEQVWKAFKKGTIFGMVISLFANEVGAEVSGSREGLLENEAGASNQTVLDQVWNEATNHHVEHLTTSGDSSDFVVSPDTDVVLPKGYTATVDAQTHELNVTGPNNLNVDHLKLTNTGTLTDQSLQELKQAGVNVKIESDPITQEFARNVSGLNAQEFVANNKNLTTHVTRDFFYDMNAPGAQGPELDLHNPQVTNDGDVHINVGNIANNESVHGEHSADWLKLAQQGHLKIALSMSRGTQTEVFMFDVDQHGNAIIPADHPLAQQFRMHHGEWRFNGQYTELVEVRGIDSHGVTHISPLATDVGRATNSFKDIIIAKETAHHIRYTFTMPQQPQPDGAVLQPVQHGGAAGAGATNHTGEAGLPGRSASTLQGERRFIPVVPYPFEQKNRTAGRHRRRAQPRMRNTSQAGSANSNTGTQQTNGQNGGPNFSGNPTPPPFGPPPSGSQGATPTAAAAADPNGYFNAGGQTPPASSTGYDSSGASASSTSYATSAAGAATNAGTDAGGTTTQQDSTTDQGTNTSTANGPAPTSPFGPAQTNANGYYYDYAPPAQTNGPQNGANGGNGNPTPPTQTTDQTASTNNSAAGASSGAPGDQNGSDSGQTSSAGQQVPTGQATTNGTNQNQTNAGPTQDAASTTKSSPSYPPPTTGAAFATKQQREAAAARDAEARRVRRDAEAAARSERIRETFATANALALLPPSKETRASRRNQPSAYPFQAPRTHGGIGEVISRNSTTDYIIRRAIDRAVEANPLLDPTKLKDLSSDEIRSRIKSLRRAVARLIHPDIYRDIVGAQALSAFSEAFKWWSLPENDPDKLLLK